MAGIALAGLAFYPCRCVSVPRALINRLHGIPSGWSHVAPFAVRRPAHRPRHALVSTCSRGRCHARPRLMVPHARRSGGCNLVACGAREPGGVVIFGGISVGDAALLLTAGVLAGMVGSAGGIASLISYPVLLAVGVPALPANVTDTLPSWHACRVQRSALARNCVRRAAGSCALAPLALAGSSAGAALLLLTPAGVFARIVPFLVAFAALALLVQPRISAWLAKHPGKNGRILAPCGLLAVWVYHGYWGVGAGVMALAVLTLAVETNLARANALKNVLLGVADVACSVVFVLYGPVRWAAVVPLALGVLVGSSAGPSLTRQSTRGPSPRRGRAGRPRACGVPVAQSRLDGGRVRRQSGRGVSARSRRSGTLLITAMWCQVPGLAAPDHY